MILKEETLTKFGRDTSKLSPDSNKKVMTRCDARGREKAIPFRDHKTGLCHHCSNTSRAKSKGREKLIAEKQKEREKKQKKRESNKIYNETWGGMLRNRTRARLHDATKGSKSIKDLPYSFDVAKAGLEKLFNELGGQCKGCGFSLTPQSCHIDHEIPLCKRPRQKK
jgi:hypothetical protein